MLKKKSLLWEISKNKTFNGYLFGTMHVAAELAFDDLSEIYKAIDKVDVFATEIPLDNDSQQEMGKHMHLPEHIELKNLFSEKKYKKLSKILKKAYQLELDQFNKVLPLFLLNYMTQLSLSSSASANDFMDLQLWAYAKTKSIELSSVESVENHIDTLYNIPLEYQLNAVKSALGNVSKFRKQTKKMLEIYIEQDVHKLYAKSKKSLSGIKDVLLYSRNKIMVKNILEFNQEKSVFVAVGAGHLSGKKGLIHLLKKQGYKIKAISI